MGGLLFYADIGGSLIKLVYFSSDRSTPNAPITHGGRLHFKKWETKNYRDCISYIKRKRSVSTVVSFSSAIVTTLWIHECESIET